MHSKTWLEKAERLQAALESVRQDGNADAANNEAAERAAIADWLRHEFSDEPGEDTATLPLFR